MVLESRRVHISCVSATSNTKSELNFMNGAKAWRCEWHMAWMLSAFNRTVSNFEQVLSFDFRNRPQIKFVWWPIIGRQ
jgi:hypothetical protein